MIQRAAAGVPQLFDWRARRKGGSLFWVEVAIKKAIIGGKPCVIAVLRDVTERKATEEKFRQMEDQLAHVSRLSTMGEMVAGIAHELNQPLYAIKNFATASNNFLASDDKFRIDDAREMNMRITNAAQRAGEIINGMRAFAGRSESNRSLCRLNDIVADSLQLVAFETKRRNIKVEFQEDATQPVVSVDRIQIQQVVVNLLQNAMEALREIADRSPRISVVVQSNGTRARVTVTDNGCGLRQEERNVFEPFVTTKREGMGMGLAISRTIVEAHRGSIDVLPSPQKGAAFQFCLPLA
jgi:two-component system sensor kinase FixL